MEIQTSWIGAMHGPMFYLYWVSYRVERPGTAKVNHIVSNANRGCTPLRGY